MFSVGIYTTIWPCNFQMEISH